MSTQSIFPGGSTRVGGLVVTALIGMASGGVTWAVNSLVTGGATAAVTREQIATEQRRLDAVEARLAAAERTVAELPVKVQNLTDEQARLTSAIEQQARLAREDMAEVRRALRIPR